MLFQACNRNISPHQRRSLLKFGILLIIAVVTFMVAHLASEHSTLSKPLVLVLNLIPILPIGALIFVVSSYLSSETDEFVRLLVTRSLLWGIGATMISDIVLAAFFNDPRALHLAVVYNVDVFCITAMIAMAIQLRRNQ